MIGNYFIFKRFTVSTLLWSLEFLIQIILEHNTIAELTCVCRLFWNYCTCYCSTCSKDQNYQGCLPAWGDLLWFSVPGGTEEIAGLWLARGDQYPGWLYGSKVFFKKKPCYGWRKRIGDDHNSKTCTKRRKRRDWDGKHPIILHGLQLKKNDKGKSEKDIRKKEADKIDSAGLTYASTKMNYVISMFVVPVKVQSKIWNTDVSLIIVVKEVSQRKPCLKNWR